MKDVYSKTRSPVSAAVGRSQPPSPTSAVSTHKNRDIITSSGREMPTQAADSVISSPSKPPGTCKTLQPSSSRLSSSNSQPSNTRPSTGRSSSSSMSIILADSSDTDSDSDKRWSPCTDNPNYDGSNINSPSPDLSLAQRPERSQSALIPDGHNNRKLYGIIDVTMPDTSTESELSNSVDELRTSLCGSNGPTPRYVGSTLNTPSPDLKLAGPPGNSQTAPAPDGHNPPREERYIRKMRGLMVQAENDVEDESRIKEETRRLRTEVKALQKQKKREERAEQERLCARDERAAEHRELLAANHIDDDGGIVVWIKPGGFPLSSENSSPSDMPGVPRLKYRGDEMRFYGRELALDVLRIPSRSPPGPEDAECCQPLPVTPPPLEVVGHTYKVGEPSTQSSVSRTEELLEECRRIQEAPPDHGPHMVNVHNEPIKNVYFILGNNCEKRRDPAPPPPPSPQKLQVSTIQMELGREAPNMTRPVPSALAPKLKAAKRAKEKNDARLKEFPDPSLKAHMDHVAKRNSAFMAHVDKSRDGRLEKKVPSSVPTLPSIQPRTSKKGQRSRPARSDPVFPPEVPSPVAALRPLEGHRSSFRLPPIAPNVQIPCKRLEVPECLPTWRAKNAGLVHRDVIGSNSNKDNYEHLPTKPPLPALPRMKRAQRGQNTYILRNVANVTCGRV